MEIRRGPTPDAQVKRGILTRKQFIQGATLNAAAVVLAGCGIPGPVPTREAAPVPATSAPTAPADSLATEFPTATKGPNFLKPTATSVPTATPIVEKVPVFGKPTTISYESLQKLHEGIGGPNDQQVINVPVGKPVTGTITFEATPIETKKIQGTPTPGPTPQPIQSITDYWRENIYMTDLPKNPVKALQGLAAAAEKAGLLGGENFKTVDNSVHFPIVRFAMKNEEPIEFKTANAVPPGLVWHKNTHVTVLGYTKAQDRVPATLMVAFDDSNRRPNPQGNTPVMAFARLTVNDENIQMLRQAGVEIAQTSDEFVITLDHKDPISQKINRVSAAMAEIDEQVVDGLTIAMGAAYIDSYTDQKGESQFREFPVVPYPNYDEDRLLYSLLPQSPNPKKIDTVVKEGQVKIMYDGKPLMVAEYNPKAKAPLSEKNRAWEWKQFLDDPPEKRIERLRKYFDFKEIISVTAKSGKNIDIMIDGSDGFSAEGAKMTQTALLEIQKIDPTMFDEWVDNLRFNCVGNITRNNGTISIYPDVATTLLNYTVWSDSNRGPAGNDGIIGKIMGVITHETDGHIRQEKEWGGKDAKTGCIKRKSLARQPHPEADATQAVRNFIDRNIQTTPIKYNAALEYVHYANMLSYSQYFDACK